MTNDSIDDTLSGPAKKRVLVAEDDALHRKLLRLQLQGLYDLDFATNGQEAVQKQFATPYDLILMDEVMPVLMGTPAAEKIKAVFPDVPIFGITARALPREGYGLIYDKVFFKPYHPEILIATMKTYI